MRVVRTFYILLKVSFGKLRIYGRCRKKPSSENWTSVRYPKRKAHTIKHWSWNWNHFLHKSRVKQQQWNLLLRNGATFESWLVQSSEASSDSTLCTVLNLTTRLPYHHSLLSSLLLLLPLQFYGFLKLPNGGSLGYSETLFQFPFKGCFFFFFMCLMWVYLCCVQERMNERLRDYEAELRRKKDERLNEFDESSKFWKIVVFFFFFTFWCSLFSFYVWFMRKIGRMVSVY